MAGHDWEALSAQLENATGDWSRGELVALLRDLIREYVLERGLPTGTAAQAATPDLSAFDFPQLIGWLKNTLALPELELFQVDGRTVIVDADGPRQLSLDRATETVVPRLPVARGTRQMGAPTAPARPAATSQERAEPSDDRAAKGKGLGQGFRGLEFD